MLNGLAENFLSTAFGASSSLNGHGGNDVPGRQAVFELRQRHRQRDDLLLLFATYWSLGARPETDATLAQREMGHACEWETSMMLRLAPHLVGDFAGRPRSTLARRSRRPCAAGLRRNEPARGISASPTSLPAEKGETLFRVFADDVAAMLERVIQWDGQSWNG